MKFEFAENGDCTPEQLKAQQEFANMIKAAQQQPHMLLTAVPFKNSSFFCPSVLQREFMVARQGDKINGRPVTHIATQYVSSCMVLVLHSEGQSPVTALAHFDWKTDLVKSIDAILAEFPGKPTRAEIRGSAFQDRLFHTLTTQVNPDVALAQRAISDLENTRNENILTASMILFDRYIPVTQIKLDEPGTTFITDIETGLIWCGEEPENSISYHRNTDNLLKNFFSSGKDRVYGTAISPYRDIVQRSLITLPCSYPPSPK